MKLASVVQLAGIAALTTAGALVDAALGFTVAGVALVVIGVAEERKRTDAS